MPEAVWYLVPLIPLGIRFVLGAIHWRQMAEPLGSGEADAESHRTVVTALAGFSFTGLMALIVVDAALRTNYQLAIYFLLVSFLCYLQVLNLQGYKLRRWHDQVGDALQEAASLSLILAVVQTMWAGRLATPFLWGVSLLSLLVWSLDFLIRVSLSYRYLSRIRGDRRVRGQEKSPSAPGQARRKGTR